MDKVVVFRGRYFCWTTKNKNKRSSNFLVRLVIANLNLIFICFSSVALIVNGFCKEVFSKLPMEFAVEARKLMEISLEGAIG